jgi:tRNA U55 pseudouridine synthase TruB
MALGCPAHLARLVRLRVGPFTIDDAVDLRVLAAIAYHGSWDRVLYAADFVELDSPAVVAPAQRANDYDLGREWAATNVVDCSPATMARLYTEDGRFHGFVRHTNLGRWQRARGLPPAETAIR